MERCIHSGLDASSEFVRVQHRQDQQVDGRHDSPQLECAENRQSYIPHPPFILITRHCPRIDLLFIVL